MHSCIVQLYADGRYHIDSWSDSLFIKAALFVVCEADNSRKDKAGDILKIEILVFGSLEHVVGEEDPEGREGRTDVDGATF